MSVFNIVPFAGKFSNRVSYQLFVLIQVFVNDTLCLTKFCLSLL